MKDRINHIINTLQLTAAKFADEIGVQRSSISHILSERNNPSLEFVLKIINKYPDISLDWLVKGTGEMKIPVKTTSPTKPNFHPSLFDQQLVNQSYKEAEIVQKPPQSSVNPPQPAVVEPSVINPISNDETIISQAFKSDVKNVERVIIFYTDRTFKEYKPEN